MIGDQALSCEGLARGCFEIALEVHGCPFVGKSSVANERPWAVGLC